MHVRSFASWLAALAVIAALGVAAWGTRGRWLHLLASPAKSEAPTPDAGHPHGDRVKLSPQARKNLGLVVGPAEVTKVYWKSIPVPGTVVDRPGLSDRGVTAPVTGVVSKIHAFPSDTVKPGDPLFDLRITSELVQNAQAELFKATKERELNEVVLKRLLDAGGVVAEVRLLEVRNQQARLDTQTRSSRQILQALGLTEAQLDAAAEGKFVREATVSAPPASAGGPASYEVQDLKVQPGEQVQAGQILGTLADHRLLYIEGRGFNGEAALLARATENAWPVEAELPEGDKAWPALGQALTIRHMANTMDRASRTFAFYVPLANQSRPYERDGKTFQVWRFRPGQRVRLHVRVEALEGVIVLPAAACVREGAEAYVFRVNGDAFDRKPVTVLHETPRDVVLADDGSIAPGLSVARNSAAALNRALAAQKAGDGGHDHHGHSH